MGSLFISSLTPNAIVAFILSFLALFVLYLIGEPIFLSYTPDFLALVWVGFDNGDSVYATGSGAALPIFAELVKLMPGYISRSAFTIPPGVVKKRVCRQSGELAVFLLCPETYDEYFLEENQPEVKCHIHAGEGVFKGMFNGVKNLFE